MRFIGGMVALVVVVVVVVGPLGLLAADASGPPPASFAADLSSPEDRDAGPRPDLGPVQFSPLPDNRLRAPIVASEGPPAPQVIELEIRGGSLSLSSSGAEVTLRRVGDQLVADLPEITVIDARGSLAGWTVTATVEHAEVAGRRGHLAPEDVRIVPSAAEVVHGNDVARLGDAAPGSATLATAPEGDGGGTFVVQAGLHVDVGDDDVRSGTVEVSFAVQ